MKKFLLGTVLALPLLGSPIAHAALIADGVTYNLSYSVVNSSTETFTLAISGINGSADTEKGRYGVEAIAFTNPIANNQPTSVSAPTGFAYRAGGLNSSGCNGSGNFFCLAAVTTPTGPVLSANSTLSYTFTISTGSALFPSNYTPDLKINWEGTKNNYDLVSLPITPTPSNNPPPNAVPEPSSMAVVGVGLAALGLLARRKARQAG